MDEVEDLTQRILNLTASKQKRLTNNVFSFSVNIKKSINVNTIVENILNVHQSPINNDRPVKDSSSIHSIQQDPISQNEIQIISSLPGSLPNSLPENLVEEVKIPSGVDNNRVGGKYTTEFKKEAVALAIKYNNNRLTADSLRSKYPNLAKLDEKSIRDWRKDPDLQPEDVSNTKKNTVTRRTKAKYPAVEEKLICKIKEFRKQKNGVSAAQITTWAKELCGDTQFVASAGWFQRFKKRSKLSLRVATHVVQQLKDNYQKEMVLYFNNIRNKRINLELSQNNNENVKFVFGNMDEVPIQFDLSNGKTYDFVGKRQINLLKTTGTKKRFTAVLGIMSNGVKLPLLLIFKGLAAIPYKLRKKYKDDVIIHSNVNGWMVESIMLEWVKKVWDNFKISKNEKKFLIFDKFSVHKKRLY